MQVSDTLRALLIQLARLNEQIERQEQIEKHWFIVAECNEMLPTASSENAPNLRETRDYSARILAIFQDESLSLAEAKAIAFA